MKTIGLKLTKEEEEKVNLLQEQGLTNSDILRQGLQLRFDIPLESLAVNQTVNTVNPVDGVDDDIYNMIYTDVYSREICPLEIEKKHLKSAVAMLMKDKEYFKQRFDALLLVKTPLISRIKTKLLRIKE